jgi:acyl-CoA hydrolase
MKFDSIIDAAAGNRMTVPEGWGQGRATFGGLVGAILIRHMDAHLGDGAPPLRSFTISFVAPMVPGPVDLEATTLRAGKSVTQVQVMARQEGQVVATMLGSLGHGRESSIRVPGPEAPRWKAPQDCFKLPYMEGRSPTFLRFFDMRIAGGNMIFSGSDEPGQTQDAATLACLVDTWPAGVLPMLSKPAPASSLTWTMELLEDPRELAPVDFWQYQVITDSFADGYGQCQATVWDDRGRPVALSRQTVVVFG